MSTAFRARAVISRAALVENARLVSERVAPAALAIVVKDDAYAHGRDEVVATLARAGHRCFGALDLTTALAVRQLVPDGTIFAWSFGAGDDLESAIRARLELGVSYPSMLERVADAAACADTRARVHLKIDTGLHRAGVRAENWTQFVRRASELQRMGKIEVTGLWTHIAEASYEADSDAISRFESAVQIARASGLSPRWRHLAASAASFERADARFDMVRVGAFVYGIAPGDGIGPEQLGLTPALTLSTTVSAVEHRDGHTVATIPLGQVHGLYSDAERGVEVTLGAQRHRITRVERTATQIDVGNAPVAIGDEVHLFGDGSHGESSLQVWADAMGSIGEEIVIRLAHPAEHVYID